MAHPQVEVRDEPARYVAYLDGRAAGSLTHRLVGRRLVLIHTQVDPAFEGQGVGSALARHAIDAARRQGLAVVPLCPFVRQFLERHPEAADIVAPEHRPRLSAGPRQE